MQHEKRRHFEGFDGLRLLAAISVIFSHAFLIATGSEESEPVVRLLGPGNILGLYGVFTFFIISGFLLARSLASNAGAIAFTVSRVLRIFPGYVCAVLLVGLVIGPLFTSLPVGQYFSSPEVRNFVRDALNSLGDAYLPGVFASDSGAAGIVNGSLWSLRYEALSYVFLLFLWISLRSIVRVTWVITVIAVLTWVWPAFAGTMPGLTYTLPYFAAGVLMQWVYERYHTKPTVALACVGLLALSALIGIQIYAFALFGAYLIVFAAERPNIGSRFAEKFGDCSYGLYLYGWPTEQMIRQVTGTHNPWLLFLLAVPMTFVFALLSCHIIERPAMRMRSTVVARLKALTRPMMVARPAAVLAAKAVFVVGTALILVSRYRWWYFIESMAELLVWVVAGALLGAVLNATIVKFATKKSAVGVS
jgi:peptidoglycan/LPS O-acetylase OafA/YrhL